MVQGQTNNGTGHHGIASDVTTMLTVLNMEKWIHDHKDKPFSIGTAKKAPLQKENSSFLQETSHLFFSCLIRQVHEAVSH